ARKPVSQSKPSPTTCFSGASEMIMFTWQFPAIPPVHASWGSRRPRGVRQALSPARSLHRRVPSVLLPARDRSAVVASGIGGPIAESLPDAVADSGPNDEVEGVQERRRQCHTERFHGPVAPPSCLPRRKGSDCAMPIGFDATGYQARLILERAARACDWSVCITRRS